MTDVSDLDKGNSDVNACILGRFGTIDFSGALRFSFTSTIGNLWFYGMFEGRLGSGLLSGPLWVIV